MNTNPSIVRNKIKRELGLEVFPSNRKNKKYKVQNPETKEWIHFGDSRYEDYTKHKDEKRRENFRRRNKSWKDAPVFTPRYFSYHFLW